MDKLAAEPAVNPMAVETKSQPAQVKSQPDAFGSFGEQLLAVKHWYTSGGMTTDTRLINIKAIAGANETVGSDGGFLLQPTFNGMFLQPMHETGVFTSRLGGSLPVAPNSNSGMIYGVDETSRATGSRWGGIRGYRVAEGETITGSKPKFREINWRLHKYAVLVYATDELLADSTQLQTIVNRGASEELDFMVNNDVLWGTGAGMLAGVMNSAALIQVAKENGQDAATINYKNLTKMWARLDKRSKSNAFWFINTDVTPQLDQLALPVGLGGLPANYITYGADGVMRIKGRPVVETEFNETLGTLGDILLIDPTQYLMWEKDGVQMASSIHVQFLTDQSVFRFIYRVDGQPAVSQQLTPFKGSGNTVSPFVALATRS
jgi:HK97 family phage major capsid protein